jgi:hypothetical protein
MMIAQPNKEGWPNSTNCCNTLYWYNDKTKKRQPGPNDESVFKCKCKVDAFALRIVQDGVGKVKVS